MVAPPKRTQHASTNATPTRPPEVTIAVGFFVSNAYASNRVDGRLDHDQARTARSLLDSLTQRGARLRDGHYVQRPLDVFRWLLERAAEEIDCALSENPVSDRG